MLKAFKNRLSRDVKNKKEKAIYYLGLIFILCALVAGIITDYKCRQLGYDAGSLPYFVPSCMTYTPIKDILE